MIQIDSAKAEIIRIADIKQAAGRVILETYPDWKQRNHLKRAVQLTRTESKWSPADAVEAATLEAWGAWVDAVRAASDAAEKSGTSADKIKWPQPPK
jgi:hypothetical protein